MEKPAHMILVNGRHSQAVPANDRGLAYGDGVFRTLLVQAGAPRHWQRQYRKLAADCAVLRLRCPPEALLEDEIRSIAPADGIAKIIVTRGAGERGYRCSPDVPVTRIVMTAPMPPYPDSHLSEGVRVIRCRIELAQQPALAGVKHLNRLENVLARAEWTDDTIAEGILCDSEGRVIGGTMSNVFAVLRGELVTPSLQRCGVAGVTRERAMDAALELGMACRIRDVAWTEFLQAEEVFLVNSVFGVWPVREIDGRTLPIGPVARDMRQWLDN
jgi:4-amino-4-deoxychorismate lyase